ncbi:Cytidine deaminase-like protein, partial [Amanita muscaria]
FSSPGEMLDFVTKRWQDNFVTSDLRTREHVEMFIKRPFFLLVSVDAPLYQRYKRSNKPNASLEDFVIEDDCLVFGGGHNTSLSVSLHDVRDLIDIQIANTFRSRRDLESYLEELNLLDVEHLRPGWDAYFMTLASLASRRSNCMKRRVGAVLVRDKRIIAAGYNGTARGLLNCNEGGCPECNKTTSPNAPRECVCLHAEENALLEAGRERIGQDAVLYCNTCPCLRCTVKIIQTGVRTVVYNLSYKVDDASSALFKQAGVELRRFNPS